MNTLSDIANNKVLVIALVAWAIAQTTKVVLILLKENRLDLHSFYGSGGMPSSHTTLVFALSTSVAMTRGFHSIEFAIAAILTMIVTYDAAGVRRAVSKQAIVLNRLIREVGRPRDQVEHDLRELIGHTPMQVIAGAALGMTIAWLALTFLPW